MHNKDFYALLSHVIYFFLTIIAFGSAKTNFIQKKIFWGLNDAVHRHRTVSVAVHRIVSFLTVCSPTLDHNSGLYEVDFGGSLFRWCEVSMGLF